MAQVIKAAVMSRTPHRRPAEKMTSVADGPKGERVVEAGEFVKIAADSKPVPLVQNGDDAGADVVVSGDHFQLAFFDPARDNC